MNKEFRYIHGYKNHDEHNVFITLVLVNFPEMLHSEFPQALDINSCPSTIVCNIFIVMNVSGDILNDDENVEDKDEYYFTRSIFKKAPVIIDNNTKIQLMKILKIPKCKISITISTFILRVGFC